MVEWTLQQVSVLGDYMVRETHTIYTTKIERGFTCLEEPTTRGCLVIDKASILCK